jgi:prepilin-type N-terminal cleavage/methylation domain-containing protein
MINVYNRCSKLFISHFDWFDDRMRRKKLKTIRIRQGFTLVELLVSLMIVAIVLTAAGTMAGALSGAKEANDQLSRDTTTLLQIQTRLSDLVMRANEVTLCEFSRLILWHDTNADGIAAVDNSEYTTIETDGTALTIYRNDNPGSKEIYRNCQLTDIYGDEVSPDTTWVMIQFTMTEFGITQTYSVKAGLRAKN